MTRTKSGLGIALVAAGLGLAAIGALSFGSSGAAEETPMAEQVKRGSVEETVMANGVLEPVQLINVGAQVSGQLKTLHVSLGQTVKAGDLIAEIDSVPQANALRIAQAGLASAKAQRRAKAIQYQQAEKAYRRQQILAGQKASSQADLESREATYKSLEADIEALDARLAQAAVEVENAEASLGYTKVRAPISGTVVSVVAKAGQTLNSVQAVPTIIVLAQLDAMRVKVQISEADIERVRAAQDIRFTVMGRPDAPVNARLEAIDPAPTAIANDTSATTGQTASQAVYYTGRFTTPNTDGRLRPMMTVSTTIVVGRAENVPLVAWSVLTRRDKAGLYHVTVLSGSGKTEERTVRIGLTDRIHAQVLEGLAEGDRVVVPADGETTNPMEMLGL
ncbi:macrolide-specific efflux system membrane fusion protein [Rhizobium aquaticum]|uniref:Macrolide-specific efflux system membrane fusion protein n=1 Tax=Rhizobium aquaticum TaxID=1549636 RepID=A0ABV2J0J0_9HYPH